MCLIILFHQVDETAACCAPISMDHTLIQGVVDYLVQGHVSVVTNNEGMIIENRDAQATAGLGLHRQSDMKH